MDAAVAALLGALIGGVSGVAGQVIAARYTARTERRRLAVEAGLREWERLHAQVLEKGGSLDPPIEFVSFADDLMRVLDSRKGLTPEAYEWMSRRNKAIRALVRAEHEERKQRAAARRGT